MKISILGAAGNIGQGLSLILKRELSSVKKEVELFLYDINPIILGVGLDLSHIPTNVKVQSSRDIINTLYGADIVVITAGVTRKPGMNRSDLFTINAALIYNFSQQIAKICPEAMIAVITNPLNTTVCILAEVLKKYGYYNKKKIFGITTLDFLRSLYFISEYKAISCNNLHVTVIGGHSSVTILPLLSKISGVSFTEAEVISLTNKLRNAGTEVVNAKDGQGSASLSMASAAAQFIISLFRVLNGDKNIVECAYIEGNGKYAKFFSQPFVLDQEGVSQLKNLEPLSSFEKTEIKRIVPFLEEDIKMGEEFVKQQLT
ncbi:MAG: malate dehydrogenase [Candidatus Dasytiphilus stammeri]